MSFRASLIVRYYPQSKRTDIGIYSKQSLSFVNEPPDEMMFDYELAKSYNFAEKQLTLRHLKALGIKKTDAIKFQKNENPICRNGINPIEAKSAYLICRYYPESKKGEVIIHNESKLMIPCGQPEVSCDFTLDVQLAQTFEEAREILIARHLKRLQIDEWNLPDYIAKLPQ